MLRSFYSYAFLIELDKCSICRITWFDADELEMLQCLIENKVTAALPGGIG
jgi:Zn-finger nucleic acid-binding protein